MKDKGKKYRDDLEDLTLNNKQGLKYYQKTDRIFERKTSQKVLDEDKCFGANNIHTLFREQGITIVSILIALSIVISTTVLAIAGVFEDGRGSLAASGLSSANDKEALKKKWFNKLATYKILAGKVAEPLLDILGRVVGVILGFCGRAVGFVAEHRWVLTVFVAGILGVWLMQKIKTQTKSKINYF